MEKIIRSTLMRAAFLMISFLYPTVFDGTTTPISVLMDIDVTDGDEIKGFVDVVNGINIAADNTVTLGISNPIIAASMLLHHTGKIILTQPLILGAVGPFIRVDGGIIESAYPDRPAEIYFLSDAQILGELKFTGTAGGVINMLGNSLLFDDQQDLWSILPGYTDLTQRGALGLYAPTQSSLKITNAFITDMGDEEEGINPRLRANRLENTPHEIEIQNSRIYLPRYRGYTAIVSPDPVVTCSNFILRLSGVVDVEGGAVFDTDISEFVEPTLAIHESLILSDNANVSFGPNLDLICTGTVRYDFDEFLEGYAPLVVGTNAELTLDTVSIESRRPFLFGSTVVKGETTITSFSDDEDQRKIILTAPVRIQDASTLVVEDMILESF